VGVRRTCVYPVAPYYGVGWGGVGSDKA
jgi:hypothetical protein